MKQKFCSHCGALAVIKKRVAYYNTDTGEPVYEYKLVCTQHKWLHLSLWHDFWEYL